MFWRALHFPETHDRPSDRRSARKRVTIFMPHGAKFPHDHRFDQPGWVWRIAIVLTLFAAPLTFGSAGAATVTVCAGGCMYTTIQAGLDHANPGDTVAVGAGTYRENVVLKAGVSVHGAGVGRTIVDGMQRNSAMRAISASVGPDVVISELTLRNGRAVNGGGLLLQGASPTLRNIIIEDSQATASGGGLAVVASGSPALRDVTLRNNSAANGGGLAVSGVTARLLMQGGALTSNSATVGGAAFAGVRGVLQISGAVLTGNQAAQFAGSVLFSQQSTGSIEDSELTDNLALAGHGGAVIIQDQANAALRRNTLRRNRAAAADGIGGAVKVYATGSNTVTLEANIFENNAATNGGALHIQSAWAEVIANRFQNNTATQFGGAVVVTDDSRVQIEDNTFDGNSAGVDGGALIIQFSSGGQVIHNTFTNNRASLTNGNSGAIKVYISSSPLISQNRLEGNEARDGGGLYIESLSAPIVTGNVIRNNHSAVFGGGVAVRESAPALFGNQIVFNRSDQNGGGIFISESVGVTLQANEIAHNTAQGSGGGLALTTSTGNLFDNTIAQNQALGNAGGNQPGGHGGGLLLDHTSLTAHGNLFSANQAANLGGGVVMQAGSQAAWAQERWVGNTAAQGAGIFASSGSTLRLTQSTLTDNRATGSGGALLMEGGDAELQANEIAFNQANIHGAGILIQANATARLDNNLIRNNRTLDASAAERSALALVNATATLRANTIVGNDGVGLNLSATTAVTVTENIVVANLAGIAATSRVQATLAFNNLWGNTGGNCRGLPCGTTDLSLDPLFATGPYGPYYLSQVAAGQAVNSPLVDAGGRTAADLGLDDLTTRTDGVPDRGQADVGVHYPPFAGQPRLWLPTLGR